jgi:hypothetical protein
MMLRYCGENARIDLRPRVPLRARRRHYRRIHHAKKILRRMPSACPSTASLRRKTRESAPNRFARRRVEARLQPASGVTIGEIFACGSAARSESYRDRDARAHGWRASNPDPLPDERVDGLRVGFAARCLHDLPDEPAEHVRLRLGLLDLVGALGDDLVDDPLDLPRRR